VSGNHVLGLNKLPGLEMMVEELADGIKASITVARDTIIEQPVHLCFGMPPWEGVQRIVSRFTIGRGARVKFLAHCSFPNAVKVRHIMQSEIYIAEGAAMEYDEAHFHGPRGGTAVYPRPRSRSRMVAATAANLN